MLIYLSYMHTYLNTTNVIKLSATAVTFSIWHGCSLEEASELAYMSEGLVLSMVAACVESLLYRIYQTVLLTALYHILTGALECYGNSTNWHYYHN